MTKDEEIDKLWFLAKPKDVEGKWKSNHWPIIRAGRGDLERAWSGVTKGKSEEERQAILKAIELALPEQAKGRRREGGFMPQPVGVGRYIRDMRWFDPITKEENIDKINLKNCQCGKPVMGPIFNHCQKCYPDTMGFRSILRDYCKKHQLHKKTRKECVAFVKSRIKQMVGS